MRKQGFTLIELLVVIAIIGVLVSLVIPSLSKARETAVQLTCLSRIRDFNVYIEEYRNDNRYWYPANAMSAGVGGPFTGYWLAEWELVIRPYFPKSSYSYGWTSARTSSKTNLFLCPTYKPYTDATASQMRTTQAWIESSIVGNYRISAVFGFGSPSSHSVANRPIYSAKREIKQVTPSAAVLVGEQFRDPPDMGYLGDSSTTYYPHVQTSNVLFGDGHAGGTKSMAVDIANKKYQFLVH